MTSLTFENTHSQALVFVDGEHQATIQKLRRNRSGRVWVYVVEPARCKNCRPCDRWGTVCNDHLESFLTGSRTFGGYNYEHAYEPTLAELRSALKAAKAWVTRLARERAQAEAEAAALWDSLDDSEKWELGHGW